MALTSRLFILRHHPSFPDPDLAPERDVLNCIRVLTRLLPYLYEKETLQSWEQRFFWGSRRKRSRRAVIANEILFDEAEDDGEQQTANKDDYEETKPLAEELIDTLIDLLFFSDFTITSQPHGRDKVTFAIWQSGVGCHTAVATTKEYENNRAEVLRLLLALAGQSMYTTPGLLTQNGIRTLTYLCTSQDKQIVLSVLCSLLNTVSDFLYTIVEAVIYPIACILNLNTDPQVQSGDLARAVQQFSFPGLETESSHLLIAVYAHSTYLSDTRISI